MAYGVWLVACVGGGRSLMSLLDIALAPEFLPNALVVIVLDLSKVPHALPSLALPCLVFPFAFPYM